MSKLYVVKSVEFGGFKLRITRRNVYPRNAVVEVRLNIFRSDVEYVYRADDSVDANEMLNSLRDRLSLFSPIDTRTD